MEEAGEILASRGRLRLGFQVSRDLVQDEEYVEEYDDVFDDEKIEDDEVELMVIAEKMIRIKTTVIHILFLIILLR